MVSPLFFLAVLSTSGPTAPPPRPFATVMTEPYDAPPSCKDQCTITFNSCINGGGDVQGCLDAQTACYNNCDATGGGGGHIQQPYM
jgi:hypothetical protein